ncbi:benzoyl-CoA 2,3-epoxidase subunit BoxB [Polyangium aurulentum]|uniref:benzoyl-CoA 2,3-epoxidase subunit BoxB n=1 Tax=Polyangium aurulentum TaxID=2567896 RepID=UPI0010AEA18D|nr:benzoyl-CoA 2,3-epoxidase subunit BoxB [Polyangium aurulentum]UQA58034.1 benzoyl-CoA 2,3-epoxidase subunit BoxB [Polyangium aurulentum]
MSSVVNSERIPNNVDLGSDKKLQRALEAWQPRFIDWWKEMGPEGFQEDLIYLRTAVSVDHEGWAHFDYVKMPDYRWGIFLSDPVADRKIGFGDHIGESVWQSVPGEFRNILRRLVVTQGDTEPASVEQQRLLGQSCPSLYDLRNLFQVNVEEGRHLWAMVYLLHSYFGRDGREEAEALLERRSGNPDKPRILGAFNEPCQHWLSFFMFTYFTDRDGKYQLLALSESGFDPLSRTTRFMLTEEAHHMFVGETGVLRIVQRTAELMKKNANEDARAEGGIDLPTLQKYMNFWYSVSLDLFGGEISSNAATFFASSLKGRAKEDQYPDHRVVEGTYAMDMPIQASLGTVSGFKREEVPLRNAMNEVLRDEYVEDAQRGVDKWNRALEEAGIKFRLTLPSRRFHRRTGIYAGLYFDVDGKPLSKEEWERRRDEWLPSEADETYIRSLMTKPIYDPKQMAHWIAPPPRGIKGRPVDFQYVQRTV